MYFDIAIWLLFLYGVVYSSKCKQFGTSKDNFDVSFNGNSLLEINDTNHHECARTCMSFKVCKSIDYNRKTNTCKLNYVDRSSGDPHEYEVKEGSIISDISEWPSALVGTCSSRPCKENQRCYQTSGSHVCKDIMCVISQKIDNGYIQANKPEGSKFLNNASVQCDFGYFPSPFEVYCQPSGLWQSATCSKVHDCSEILNVNPEARSGLYEIQLWESGSILTVNCDMETEGGGWTIFQRRIDGSVDFYRNFTEYENGFGEASGEFWLGLKYIQEIADQGPSEVRLDMKNENNNTGFETFQEFKLTNGQKYTLNIGSREAFAVDDITMGLEYHNFSHFSTFDRDIDTGATRNCAVDRHGGWWYKTCAYVNLNGLYVTPGTKCNQSNAQAGYCGHTHVGFNGINGLKMSSMMLRKT